MKVYFYTPEDVGLEEFKPGLMRLPGFDRVENPANADLFCLPSCMFHFSKETLLNLKYLPGREDCHIVWDLCEDFRTFDVPWIAIRAACTKMMLETDPTTIPWPWPVEPLGSWGPQGVEHFCYDVAFWGWRTPLDLTGRACESVLRTPLRSFLRINDGFFGYKSPDDEDYEPLRRGFVSTLYWSRLCLVPASLDGVVRYRLYEQMSMGRGLPVHICDNAVMPWSSKINWDLITVTIPEADVDRTGEILAEWLACHSDNYILEAADYAREMYETWLHRDKWDELFSLAVRERLAGRM